MIVIVALFCFLTLVSRLPCFCWYFCSQIKLNVLLHCLIDLWFAGSRSPEKTCFGALFWSAPWSASLCLCLGQSLCWCRFSPCNSLRPGIPLFWNKVLLLQDWLYLLFSRIVTTVEGNLQFTNHDNDWVFLCCETKSYCLKTGYFFCFWGGYSAVHKPGCRFPFVIPNPIQCHAIYS